MITKITETNFAMAAIMIRLVFFSQTLLIDLFPSFCPQEDFLLVRIAWQVVECIRHAAFLFSRARPPAVCCSKKTDLFGGRDKCRQFAQCPEIAVFKAYAHLSHGRRWSCSRNGGRPQARAIRSGLLLRSSRHARRRYSFHRLPDGLLLLCQHNICRSSLRPPCE